MEGTVGEQFKDAKPGSGDDAGRRSLWGVWLPHPHDSGFHRVLLESSPIPGQLDLNCCPPDLEERLACRAIRESGKVCDTAVLRWRATCTFTQAGDVLLVFFLPMPCLHAAILSGADEDSTRLPSHVLEHTKESSPTISHLKPLACRQRRANGVHCSLPDQGFTVALEAPGVGFARWNWLSHNGLLRGHYRVQCAPISHVGGQRGCRMFAHRRCYLHHSVTSSRISQFNLSERFSRPFFRVSHTYGFHVLTFFLFPHPPSRILHVCHQVSPAHLLPSA
jgi:hypothetical protein